MHTLSSPTVPSPTETLHQQPAPASHGKHDEEHPAVKPKLHWPTVMTEAELRAAPAGDYMNERQLKFFRARLLAEQSDLQTYVEGTTQSLKESGAEADPADLATREEEQVLELRIRDRERNLIQKIHHALQRIEEGSYGYCEETGEPIGIRRLLARPVATLCIEEQERRERRKRLGTA